LGGRKKERINLDGREIMMANEGKPTNIFQSFRILKGNTRVSVLFEPLWGIPYVLYSFYLGLYMKGSGITDEQIGFLISIGCIASVVFSMLGGVITDALGRRRTTVIFDLIAWPVGVAIYMISKEFWMFALAQVVNSTVKIVAVSWNMMVVEDADREQQVAAYNLLNAINIASGILTPVAGILIKHFGIIGGERILLGLAVVSMATMVIARHFQYHETKVGRQILKEREEATIKELFQIDLGFWDNITGRPLVMLALGLSVLFNAYVPIGTYSSLYYAPFLTGVLKLDKAAIAVMGGINAGVILAVYLLLIPRLAWVNQFFVMIVGIGLQVIALGMLITIQPGGFGITAVTVAFFALGFGMAKPFIDSVLATVTRGKERAGIYAFYNTAVSLLSAGMGIASGYLYRINPAWIYRISIGVLLVCIGLLFYMDRVSKRECDTDSGIRVI
jgi:MFS family permease